MVDVPVELKQSLKKGECVLFAGSGISRGLPTWKKLVEPLAQQLGVPPDEDPRLIASWYENEYDRKKLEQEIVSQLRKKVELPELHAILPELPLKAIVTTNYDQLLEKALKKKDIFTIIYDKQATQAGADQLQLIKMHGDISDPSTIVITKKDYDEYAETHKALITHLMGLLISCNFLFVGFSLKDPNFDHIYMHIKSLFRESKRRGYAIFKNPPPFEIRRLKEEMGIETISISDYDQIPEIFEKMVGACNQPLTKTELAPSELERVQQTFREVVKRQNQYLDPRGIFQFDKMLTKRDVALEDVYVVPRLIRQQPLPRESRNPRKEKSPERAQELEEMPTLVIKDQEREMEEYTFEEKMETSLLEVLSDKKFNHLVILGNPGIGKTCLLKYGALKASTNAEKSLEMKKPLLPVFLPLREYSTFGQNKLLKEFIFYYIKNQICSLPDEVLEHFLEKNSFLFLFDGLDEVVSESERIQVSRQVEKFMAMYPLTKIVLTSRPAGYKAARLIGSVPHFTLSGFNDDEIREFLVKWFTFLKRIEEETVDGAEEEADELTRTILKRERILPLARNPLLLTILVLIHRVGKRLPERRAEFYEYAVRTVAGTWENWKRLHSQREIPDQDTIIAIMEKIGFKLHKEKQENIVEVEELKVWLKEALEEEVGHSSRKEIKDFIWMLGERAGLLTEQGFKLYGFFHLTLQEYFAARYLAVGRGSEDVHFLIRDNLYSTRWREVFLLAAAIAPPKNADSIFESILQAENRFEEYIHSNLLFAGETLADQPRISESKRTRIIDELKKLTKP